MTNGDQSRCCVSESQSWHRPRPIRRTLRSKRPCVPLGQAGIAQGTAASALVYRAVIAMDRGDWDAAARFAAEARAEVDAGRIGEQFPGALPTPSMPGWRSIGETRSRLAHTSRMPSGCDHS